MTLPRSVFRDEAILLQEYLPHQIPHREAQLKKLELYFQGVAQNASKASQIAMITGPVGCHRKGQLVLMFDGSMKRVEDVVQGDLLMGPDSAPRSVLETVHGFGKMVEVRPVKGKPFVVSEDHILTVIQTRLRTSPRKPSEDAEGVIKDVPISELLELPKRFVGPRALYKLARTGVDFPKVPEGPVDPHLLGVYLGDGGRTHGNIGLTSDPEIPAIVRDESERYAPSVRHHPAGNAQQYVLAAGRTGGQTLTSGIARDLMALGLFEATSDSKFIPRQYKFGSRETRLEVLAGLLDTDGNLASGCFDFITKSKRLAEDVAFVSRSLGFYAFVRAKRPRDRLGHEGLRYRVGISGDLSRIPTRVQMKQAMQRKQESVLRTGFTLEPLGEEEYFGFRVDSDQRYLLDDFTITHNSGKTMLAKKLLLESLPRKAALHGNLVKAVHVNCRIDRTLQAIMVKSLKSLGQNYPTRGYSFEELLAALVEELRSNRMHLVIAFDEVDSLVLSDPGSLYTITRLREMAPGAQVLSSLLISKTTDYLKKVDLSTLSSLQWNEIALESYPSEQLADILNSRSEAFSDGAIDDDVVQLAADIAGTYGDARYALDLVWRAGKLADDSGSPRVLPEHVRSAKASLPPQLRKEELSYLTAHQKLLLMAISSLLKNGSSTYVTIGEVEKSYSAICEGMNVTAYRHTQVWSDVNELSRKGIIETQLSGKGVRGRTTMIGLSLVSAKELMGELEKGMLADVRA
ncbi:MAG: AAA family ATPase [Nitrososphaerota archaeon]|jgi:orc1/cdc6 family replication initiation protein|nr:AAA family ATPase [Nitrososphaerota archaeon]MDG6953214.1 AAA family ATPase [Nitrososphaerota archaeon]MDG6956651.1 AAA family ATPase [Nitrososphaerota archaeon]MDG6972643.1 AAA family ATPase [Nitrososphaerota archaeon]MDG6976593.1 AAA family ATPase [Nitrososphaerota archaeon]